MSAEHTKHDNDPGGLNLITMRPRPHRPLPLDSHFVEAPEGGVYVNVSLDENGQPFETFVIVGKGGSVERASAEAIGRLVSAHLRRTEPTEIPDVLRLLVDQLEDIGGTDNVGFGSNRVRSIPDAVAKVLKTYLEEDDALVEENTNDIFDRVYNIEFQDNIIPIEIRFGEEGAISGVGIIEMENQTLDSKVVAITGGVCEFVNSLLDIQQTEQRSEIAEIADFLRKTFASDDPRHLMAQAISAGMADILSTDFTAQANIE